MEQFGAPFAAWLATLNEDERQELFHKAAEAGRSTAPSTAMSGHSADALPASSPASSRQPPTQPPTAASGADVPIASDSAPQSIFSPQELANQLEWYEGQEGCFQGDIPPEIMPSQDSSSPIPAQPSHQPAEPLEQASHEQPEPWLQGDTPCLHKITGGAVAFGDIAEIASYNREMPLLWKDPESIESEKPLNRFELWAFIKRKPIFRTEGQCAPKSAFGDLRPPKFFCPQWEDPPEEPLLASPRIPASSLHQGGLGRRSGRSR